MRQLFEAFQSRFKCITVANVAFAHKHRSNMCHNSAMNLTVTLDLPPLPFCTTKNPHEKFKSFAERMRNIDSHEKVLVVLHMFTHTLNYHSHVYLHSIKAMKSGVLELLKQHPRAVVVIKGPHAFAFSQVSSHVIRQPDAYVEPYTQFLKEEFKDLHERVVYLNALDITIATEQWDIHSQDFVVHDLVNRLFYFYCS